MKSKIILIEDNPQRFTPEQCKLILDKIRKDTRVMVLGTNTEKTICITGGR